jgi:hypothetical protein
VASSSGRLLARASGCPSRWYSAAAAEGPPPVGPSIIRALALASNPPFNPGPSSLDNVIPTEQHNLKNEELWSAASTSLGITEKGGRIKY